jgi:hypothetical protein
VRDQIIRAHLADSGVATAIFTLVTAAHDVNRWDLTNEALGALCDAALRYAAEVKRMLEERGMSHE